MCYILFVVLAIKMEGLPSHKQTFVCMMATPPFLLKVNATNQNQSKLVEHIKMKLHFLNSHITRNTCMDIGWSGSPEQTNRSLLCLLLACLLVSLFACLSCPLTLKMKAVHSSETVVCFNQTIWCHIPENGTLHNSCHENLKCLIICSSWLHAWVTKPNFTIIPLLQKTVAVCRNGLCVPKKLCHELIIFCFATQCSLYL
jgi:hypothetical protein